MSENEYQKEYYEQNRDLISRLRKIRYHTDRNYREKIKRRSRNRYKRSLKSPDKKLGYTVKYVSGVPLFSIKYVIGVIDKSRDFLEAWEKTGHIPRSTYTDSRGWRLYSQHQIDLLDMAVAKYDSREWNKEQVREFLFANWSN